MGAIAFVVVASLFAFTGLSAGIFSVERGKETIHAGLVGARSSMELKGSIIFNGVANKPLPKGDAAWTASGGNVTATADTTDKKEGTGSADLVIAVGFTTGLVAYSDLSATVDMSRIDSIQVRHHHSFGRPRVDPRRLRSV